MMNFKQRELSKMLFDKLKERFPELDLVGVTESPENPESLLVNIKMPDDDDRQIEIGEAASEISADILMDYGYHITISFVTELDKSFIGPLV